jgi:thiol-disulfide isomerase/thioredoxin
MSSHTAVTAPIQAVEEIDASRRRFLVAAARSAIMSRLCLWSSALQLTSCAALKPPVEGEMPSFTGATEWLNSEPLTPAGLRGKVVAIDFCTYTCINWIRSLPYVRAWSRSYRDHGLVVIGVHSPEFEFEKTIDNVRRAALAMKVEYPIAVDNDHAIWRAFDNAYWPALYLVDAQGRIRHHHFGEGGYDQAEAIIRRLLDEAGATTLPLTRPVEGHGVEAAADWGSLRSPENYLGFERTENFAPVRGASPGQRIVYTAPASLPLNHWALTGEWTMQQHSTVSHRADGRINYRFHARDVHLVMGASVRGAPVRYRVLIDGQAAGPSHGIDVDERGNGAVDGQRLYQLVRQREHITDRQLDIVFLDPGVEVFAFTFG